jgi:hypothetical protein
MKRVLLSLATVVALASTTFAYDFSAGANFMNVGNDMDAGLGFRAGVVMEHQIGELPVDFFAGLVQKNATETSTYYDYTTEINVSRTYFQVDATCKMPVNEAVSIYAGPYAGFLLLQNVDVKSDWGDYSMDDAFDAFDCGINLGAEINVDAFAVGAHYSLGLIDTADGEDSANSGFEVWGRINI